MTDKRNSWLNGDWEDIPTTNPDDPKAERQEVEKDTDGKKQVNQSPGDNFKGAKIKIKKCKKGIDKLRKTWYIIDSKQKIIFWR